MKHKNLKHEHAKNMTYEQACKLIRSLEIVTKPRNYSKSPNMVVVPPNLLDSDAFNMCPSSPLHPPSRHHPSHVL